MSKIEKILNNFSEATGTKLVGCSDKEILDIEKYFGDNLPKEYENFMRIAGKKAGELFVGSDVFYPNVLNTKRGTKDLLEENNLVGIIPDNVSPFFMHQGYIINFFLDNSDDPKVYEFMEGDAKPKLLYDRFSEFLNDNIQSYIKHLSILKSS